MKRRENKSLLKTNYSCWRAVSSPKDSSQLTKFEGNRLVYPHVADVKTGFLKTGFLKTGFDKPVSCSTELEFAKFCTKIFLMF